MQCSGSTYLKNNPYTIIDGLTDISFDNCEIPEYASNLYVTNPQDAELSFECDINVDLFKQICGLDLANSGMSCSMELNQPYQVQKRRHKKKRINKKWAKKYGYLTMFKSVKIRDCSIVTHEDGFDVTGKY
jgi:hypothetical protein